MIADENDCEAKKGHKPLLHFQFHLNHQIHTCILSYIKQSYTVLAEIAT